MPIEKCPLKKRVLQNPLVIHDVIMTTVDKHNIEATQMHKLIYSRTHTWSTMPMSMVRDVMAFATRPTTWFATTLLLISLASFVQHKKSEIFRERGMQYMSSTPTKTRTQKADQSLARHFAPCVSPDRFQNTNLPDGTGTGFCCPKERACFLHSAWSSSCKMDKGVLMIGSQNTTGNGWGSSTDSYSDLHR